MSDVNTKPPSPAVTLGHDLAYDPSMSCSRWTCRQCGMAAIRCGLNEYGRATELVCVSGSERTT